MERSGALGNAGNFCREIGNDISDLGRSMGSAVILLEYWRGREQVGEPCQDIRTKRRNTKRQSTVRCFGVKYLDDWSYVDGHQGSGRWYTSIYVGNGLPIFIIEAVEYFQGICSKKEIHFKLTYIIIYSRPWSLICWSWAKSVTKVFHIAREFLLWKCEQAIFNPHILTTLVTLKNESLFRCETLPTPSLADHFYCCFLLTSNIFEKACFSKQEFVVIVHISQ